MNLESVSVSSRKYDIYQSFLDSGTIVTAIGAGMGPPSIQAIHAYQQELFPLALLRPQSTFPTTTAALLVDTAATT